MGFFSRLLRGKARDNVREKELNILALPDVFLRELMKSVTIRDRVNLRLVCRAFGNLVAATHAGHFKHAHICIEKIDSSRTKCYKMMASFKIGNVEIKFPIEDFESFLPFLRRLFKSISIGTCIIELHDKYADYQFIKKSIETFKIGLINLAIFSKASFLITITFISDFPETKFALSCINYFPAPEELLALPPLERLDIPCGLRVRGALQGIPAKCTSSQFLALVSTHKHIGFLNAALTPEDLEKALEIVETNQYMRIVDLTESKEKIEGWMRYFEITSETKVGDKCGKLLVTAKIASTFEEFNLQERYNDATCLRYKNSWIAFRFGWFLYEGALVWKSKGLVTIGNGEDPGTKAERILLSGS